MGPWTRTVAGGVFSCDAPVMLRARVGVVVVVAACWTSSPPPRVEKPVEPSSVPAAEEVHATLRIDATPGPKHFQGVWLELAADKRWVIDYRPHELWRGFDGQAVIVTGHCYVPFGEALLATHFKVERMRFATPPSGSVPILEVGRERLVRGMLVEHEYAAGSKLAGSRDTRFRPDTPIDGVAVFQIAGGIGQDTPTFDTPITVKARTLVGNRTYSSTSSDAQIWIVSTHEASYVEDLEHAPKIVPCPK
jgi:hypothetical protein